MALNHIQPGKTIDYANGSGVDIASGDPVLIGKLLGVALVDIPDGSSGAVALEEVWELPKATGAITVGAQLYWDADGNPVGGTTGAGALTATSTDNVACGKAFASAAEAVATVQIKLNA